MKIFFMSITTSVERNKAILCVREAIDKSGAWIIDQTFFSNISVNIGVEIPKSKIPELIENLGTQSFRVDVKSQYPKQTVGEMRCQIVLDFIHNEKDLKRVVPAFG